MSRTYPLLRQLTGTLVLAVSEQFDNAALIWCETADTTVSIKLFNGIDLAEDRTYPETSLTISRTKAVLLLRWPLVLDTRGLTTLASVFCRIASHTLAHRVLAMNIKSLSPVRVSFLSLQLCPSSCRQSCDEDPPRGETGLG